MDENLFQLVTLALLGVTLLVLLVTLLTLNKVSKRLEEVGTTESHRVHDEGHRGGELTPAPQRQDSTPEPAPSALNAAHPGPEAEPGARAEPEEERAPARHEELQPAAQPEPEVQQAAPADTTFADAPEEQPFEREGRWWFKRGDELLVYDEQSGQWEPAPAGVTTGSSPSASGGETGWQGESQPAAGTEESAQDQGSFWKCPSCGAVNGSTASACRMCFTPKP